MLNLCQFIGNLGKDVTIRNLNDGSPVASFPLAVSKKYKDRDGNRQEHTTWVDVVIFNENLCKIAEQYLRKGSKVYISGSWQNRKWEKDGQTHYKSECVLQRFNGELTMLDGRSDNTQDGSQNSGGFGGQDDPPHGRDENGAPAGNNFDDEIPF